MKHFGPLNQAVSLGGHTLVLIDAPGLVEEDYQRHARSQRYDQWTPLSGGPVEFVKSIAAGIDFAISEITMPDIYSTEKRTQPMILFSHIPLSHPESKSCGPLRERGTIRRGVGPGYQNTLDRQSTEFLLEKIRPLIVFRYLIIDQRLWPLLNSSHSGDDRDYCDYTHAISPADPDASEATLVREVTVKSFSFARNIRRPGFQLLSLAAPASPPTQSAAPTFADVPCFLPDQSVVMMSFYVPSLFITIAILVVSNAYRSRNQLRLSPFLTPISLSPHHSQSPSPAARSQSGMSPWLPMTPSWPGEEQFPLASPRTPLPALRTPNALSTPTFRTSSRPSTPNGTPLQTPKALYHNDEEEEDTMFPPQYALRQEHRSGHGAAAAWPSGYGEEGHEDEFVIVDDKATTTKKEHEHQRQTSHFLPAPGNKPSERKNWSYSWTFVFRGRRRRMTISPPDLSSMDLFRDIANDLWNWSGPRSRGRRGGLWELAADIISVAWPAALVWVFIMRWMF